MKIDRNQLLNAIVKKTDLDRETIDSQLSELISQIREASGRGNALEIKGFGMFYHSKNGELTFDPADELKTEINYKYAGMESVEVRTSREQGILPAGEDMNERYEPTAMSKSVDSPEIEKKMEPKREVPLEKEEKNPAATLITSIVTLLVIVIGIILLVDFGYLDGIFSRDSVTPQQGQEQELVQPGPPERGEDPVVTDSDDVTDNGTVPETEPPPDGEMPVVEPAEPPPTDQPAEIAGAEETEIFGLNGSFQMIDSRFYTIVIHSMQNEELARETAGELVDEGYRAIAVTILHDEHGRMWRVGIGQFETVEQAQAAAEELPEEYRTNNFIGLIQ